MSLMMSIKKNNNYITTLRYYLIIHYVYLIIHSITLRLNKNICCLHLLSLFDLCQPEMDVRFVTKHKVRSSVDTLSFVYALIHIRLNCLFRVGGPLGNSEKYFFVWIAWNLLLYCSHECENLESCLKHIRIPSGSPPIELWIIPY